MKTFTKNYPMLYSCSSALKCISSDSLTLISASKLAAAVLSSNIAFDFLSFVTIIAKIGARAPSIVNKPFRKAAAVF